MSEVANIYDNGPISPIARIDENVTIWTDNTWKPFRIRWMEGLMPSSPFTFNFCTITAPTIAANGLAAKQVLGILTMHKLELLHVRWEPIDDVEGRLYQLANAARFASRGAHARVSIFTRLRDPNLATTTFFVMGENKDAQIECLNPNPVVIAIARVSFWGFRYLLDELPATPVNAVRIPAQAMV